MKDDQRLMETVCSAFIIHIHHFHSSLILLLPPWILAERVGFEPTERFPVHSISSAANSTTLAPLRRMRISEYGLLI